MLGDMLMDKSVLLPNVGNACRSLFGPVDHAEVRKTLQRELRMFEERSQQQWNFDFKREKPLPGRWEYQEVSDVPSAYQMPQLSVKVDIIRAFRESERLVRSVSATPETGCHRQASPAPLAPESGEAEDCCVSVTGEEAADCRQAATPTPEEDLPKPQTSAATTQTSPQKRKRQAEITDFFPQKKSARTEETKSGASSSFSS